MRNPAGVVNGNYIISLTGVDLNRRWDNLDSSNHPTVFKTKETIKNISHKIRSCNTLRYLLTQSKQGLFMYGCGLESRRNNLRSSHFPSFLVGLLRCR